MVHRLNRTRKTPYPLCHPYSPNWKWIFGSIELKMVLKHEPNYENSQICPISDFNPHYSAFIIRATLWFLCSGMVCGSWTLLFQWFNGCHSRSNRGEKCCIISSRKHRIFPMINPDGIIEKPLRRSRVKTSRIPKLYLVRKFPVCPDAIHSYTDGKLRHAFF